MEKGPYPFSGIFGVYTAASLDSLAEPKHLVGWIEVVEAVT